MKMKVNEIINEFKEIYQKERFITEKLKQYKDQ